MIIGIDVGGTHADGVLLDGERVVKKNKVSVNHAALQDSIITLLESLIPEPRTRLQRIQLSTTLCTNAIVTGRLEPVGMFIQAGPGLNPGFFNCSDHVCLLGGSIDHRGQVIRTPDKSDILKSVQLMREKKINSVGIVTKFSYRNNEHELFVRDQLGDDFSHISLGHRLSGMPNFPRRVYTTWLNAALQGRFYQFQRALGEGMQKLKIDCPSYVLKADGGTIPFTHACEYPCQSIHSGPSASVMGALALDRELGDAILLDIGGTTTDICVFADSVPLLEPYGITVDGRPTLIRALQTRSISLGGDSKVTYDNGHFEISANESDKPMALGGSNPTPTDAMIVVGLLHFGDRGRARLAIEQLCPDEPVERTADLLLRRFAEKAQVAVAEMLDEIFRRPVYTISALLEKEKLHPRKLIAIGGPAEGLQDYLSRQFGLACKVPDNYEVANAIGAARARLTLQASLYGDSATGKLSIPEISAMQPLEQSFSMGEAERRLTGVIEALAGDMGMADSPDIDFIERLEMNTVRGFSTTGKIIALKAQIRPGLQPIEE